MNVNGDYCMKVKTWVRRYISSIDVEDKKARDILLNNGINHFFTYKEQIVDVDLICIIDNYKHPEGYEAGYKYCNRLYYFIHDNTIFIGEKDDLEYEIIEDGYPEDIPYAYCEFDNVEEFHKWMLEEGKKEREE
jgi:hypothetical protein